jgi:hypothetical protein
MNALVLLHLPRADLILQLDQLVLQMVKVVLMTTVPVHLCLDHLVPKGLNAQVHLIPIRVMGAEEPHVRNSIVGALTEVKEGGGVKMVRIGSGAASVEAVDSGVVHVLDLGKLGWPDASIQTVDWHGHILLA